MPEKKPPPKSKSAHPSEDDKTIWCAAMTDVTKLQQKDIVSQPKTSPIKRIKANKPPEQRGIILLETLAAPLTKSSFQVDGNLRKKFERGELPIDGKIDLHGLTLEQAHRKFISFMRRKISEGGRFLVVITGKGAKGEGVIRKNLPLWCDDSALRPYILHVSAAKVQHGGAGATYILLRRAR